jgi:hypothetical protein
MRQARFSYSLVFVLLAACGGDSKSSNPDAASNPPGDSGSTIDSPSGGGMVTISGTVMQRQAIGNPTPVADAVIAGYRNGNDTTPEAMTTSNAQGAYSLTVSTSGGPLDGYLKATKAGLKDAYLYPPAPITADAVAPMNMVSQATWDTLVGIALGGGTQQTTNGLIALIVVNGGTADSMPVAGAVVTSNPASTVRYNNGILPNGMTSTAADGTAFLLNVTATAPVTVSATAPGLTLKSHSLTARANVLTTTLITP